MRMRNILKQLFLFVVAIMSAACIVLIWVDDLVLLHDTLTRAVLSFYPLLTLFMCVVGLVKPQ